MNKKYILSGKITLLFFISLCFNTINAQVTSTTEFQIFPIAHQGDTFTFECDATPSETSNDLFIGLLKNDPLVNTDYDSLAAIIHFSPANINAYNGSSYIADLLLSYEANKTYHLRTVVDVPNSKYSVFVTQPDSIEKRIALNYSFRNTGIDSIFKWTLIHSNLPGTITVDNVTIKKGGVLIDTIAPETIIPEVSNIIFTDTDSSFVLTLTGTDNVRIEGYNLYDADTNLISSFIGDSIITKVTAPLINDSLNTFFVQAYDASGNVSEYEPIGVLAGEITSFPYWYNEKRITTSKKIPGNDEFEVHFSAFSILSGIADAAVAICKRKVAGPVPYEDWNAHAIIFRFSSSGKLDCRNGNTYHADSIVPYDVGDIFNVRFVVRPSDTTYDCYVSKNGEEEILLAENYLFRDAKNYTQLKDMAIRYVNSPIVVYDVAWDPDIIAPTVPTNLIITEQTDSSIVLSWNKATDNRDEFIIYDIYKNEIKIQTLVSDTIITISDLVPDNPYSFNVKAKDSDGNESAQSNTINVTLTDITAPSVPTNLLSTSSTDSTVTLIWNASFDNVGVTEYRLYQSNSYIKTVTTNSATISDLTFDISYSFTVSAVDEQSNESDQSENIIITLTDATAPTIPVNLRTTEVTSSYISLTWNNSTDNKGIAGYKLYVNSLSPSECSDNIANISGLNPSTLYSISVSAFDSANNESNRSEALLIKTASLDLTAPETPTGLKVLSQEPGSVILIWNVPYDSVGVEGYNVYVNTFDTLVVNTNFVEINSLSSDISYRFSVSAFDEAGNMSPLSNPIFINLVSSIKSYSKLPNLEIYPNPVSSGSPIRVNFNKSTKEQISIKIHDVYGKTIYYNTIPEDKTEVVLNPKNLKRGLYILILEGRDLQHQQKLVVY